MNTNRFRLLACIVCVLVFVFPLNALAGVIQFKEPAVTNEEYFADPASLKSMTVHFHWSGASCTSRLMLVTKPLKGSTTSHPSYGELTNLGEYGHSFDDFNAAQAFDQQTGKFGILNWTNDLSISLGQDHSLTFDFKETDIPLSQDRDYYVYLWTTYSGSFYPDYLVASINVKDRQVTIEVNTTGANDGNLAVDPMPDNPPDNPPNPPAPIAPSAVSNVPKTGDETPLMLLVALMTMSIAGATVFIRRKRA